MFWGCDESLFLLQYDGRVFFKAWKQGSVQPLRVQTGDGDEMVWGTFELL